MSITRTVKVRTLFVHADFRNSSKLPDIVGSYMRGFIIVTK
jgi:hypothetical protein